MNAFKEVLSLAPYDLPLLAFSTNNQQNDFNVHPHWHEEIEILWILSGQAKQQINEEVFLANPEDIIVINGNNIHSTQAYGSSETEILVFQFNPSQLLKNSTIFSYMGDQENLFLQAKYPNPISPKQAYWLEFKNLLSSVWQEKNKAESGFQFYIHGDLLKITGLMQRHLTSIPQEDSCRHHKYNYSQEIESAKKLIKNTFTLVDKKFNQDINLQHAASSCNLSISHFSRLFKVATGTTFSHYLANFRVRQAENLLLTDLTTEEISFKLGFSSSTAFVRTFKRIKNCSPFTYRKNFRI